jgi:hypothetical protein
MERLPRWVVLATKDQPPASDSPIWLTWIDREPTCFVCVGPWKPVEDD